MACPLHCFTRNSFTGAEMADKQNDQRNKRTDSAESEAGLQKELAREAGEGKDSIGDVGENRTLSGSSTWETLPDDASGGTGGDQKSNK
jgi:hypothetical protein